MGILEMNLWKRQLKNCKKWMNNSGWMMNIAFFVGNFCRSNWVVYRRALSMNSRHRFPIPHQYQSTQGFYTIVLVIISNSSSGLKKWVLHHTRAKEMLSFDKGSCHMQSFFVSSQWQFGCKQSPVQIPKCRIRGLRNRGKMPGWSGSRAGSSDC